MSKPPFSEQDLEQISHRGLTPDTILAQMAVILKGLPPARLARPCTLGDGIRAIDPADFDRLSDHCRKAAKAGRLTSFVPASGAASRMFKDLHIARDHFAQNQGFPCEPEANVADEKLAPFCQFAENIDRFAFYSLLAEKMAADGLELSRLAEKRNFGLILDYLLTEKGLCYAQLPKGMIAFHRYADCIRTAFEEHLVEAAAMGADDNGRCRLHFTISPAHEEKVLALFARVLPRHEIDGRTYRVDFSHQLPATDTIALDDDGRLLRDENGRLVFRPGGHGALLENLNRLDADILLIKNVDNVIPDRLKKECTLYRTLLVGLLVELQNEAFQLVDALRRKTGDAQWMAKAFDFASNQLGLTPGEALLGAAAEEQCRWLLEKLDRPMRVCGMVRNVGAPGGGPFWTLDGQDQVSCQIVESAHVNMQSRQQSALWQAATHFNPVLLVCGMRNSQQQPFDLMRYLDPQTAFIVHKSVQGKAIRGLEHPGLWNGAMAHWNTVFVEVPMTLFSPVKSVLGLIADEHRTELGSP